MQKNSNNTTNKGFTLIELVVIISIIGILVLLAVPKFLGYAQRAQATRIMHDIKVVDNKVEETLALDKEAFSAEQITHDMLLILANEGKLFDSKGKIVDSDNLTEGDTYKQVSDELVKDVKTKLNGKFYLGTGGKMYYEQIKSAIVKPDDLTTAPGNKTLIAGDMQAGYFGITSSADLISGRDLSEKVGLKYKYSDSWYDNEREYQFSEEGWLKFAYNGNIQYVAKKPFRNSIGWNNLNEADVVFGNKTIVIDGLTYKVRLLKSGQEGSNDIESAADIHGSEWNKLMLPIHERASDKEWSVPENVEDNIPDWGIGFTNKDLGADASDYGWLSAIQENIYRQISFATPSRWDDIEVPSLDTDDGWRPVLELIEMP